jgi:hypothetical protein
MKDGTERRSVADFLANTEFSERCGITSLAIADSILRGGNLIDRHRTPIGQHEHLLIRHTDDHSVMGVGAATEQQHPEKAEPPGKQCKMTPHHSCAATSAAK